MAEIKEIIDTIPNWVIDNKEEFQKRFGNISNISCVLCKYSNNISFSESGYLIEVRCNSWKDNDCFFLKETEYFTDIIVNTDKK